MGKYNPWTPEELELIRELARTSMPYKNRIKFFPGRTQDALRNKTYEVRQAAANEWLDFERVAFLDIETTNLKANIGFMISWSIKYLNGKVINDIITRKEAIDADRQDKRIIKNLIKVLEKDVDVIVTYYGSRFDVPFVRTRAMMWEIDFPKFGSKKHIDMYFVVRSKMRLHSNRLAVACRALGIKGKTPLHPDVWRRAALGYAKELKEVLKHNDEDVKILERLYKRLLPFTKTTRRSL